MVVPQSAMHDVYQDIVLWRYQDDPRTLCNAWDAKCFASLGSTKRGGLEVTRLRTWRGGPGSCGAH